MTTTAPVRYVFADLQRQPACDHSAHTPELVQVGNLVHLVCPGCTRDLDWPLPAQGLPARPWPPVEHRSDLVDCMVYATARLPRPAAPALAPAYYVRPAAVRPRRRDWLVVADLACAALVAGCLCVAGWSAWLDMTGTAVIALASAVPLLGLGAIIETIRWMRR